MGTQGAKEYREAKKTRRARSRHHGGRNPNYSRDFVAENIVIKEIDNAHLSWQKVAREQQADEGPEIAKNNDDSEEQKSW